MYLIDTNIFLEYFLDRKQADKCELFLEKISSGQINAIMTVFSLHSIAVILENLEGVEEYQKFLETITEFEGLLLYSLTPKEEITVCKTSNKNNLSFDDAYQYQAAKSLDLKLVSLDDDFDKTDITRLKPEEV